MKNENNYTPHFNTAGKTKFYSFKYKEGFVNYLCTKNETEKEAKEYLIKKGYKI